MVIRATGTGLLTATVLAVMPATSAWAEAAATGPEAVQVAQADAAYSFDIPAQPLRQALLDFGRQADIQIAFPAGLAADVRAPAIRGSFRAEEALSRLLAGSGLTYRFTGQRTVTLTRPVESGSGETMLGPVVVEAESDDILVQDGYVPLSGQIGSKTDTPLLKVPQAISVVTERQLDDRAPKTLNEVLEYTPGVNTTQFGFDPRYDTFTVRGFSGTYNGVFRDGIRQFQGASAVYANEPYGMEAVAVLKGPSSTLYGATSAGGMANIMTKRPTDDPLYEVEGIWGTHERYQGNVDISDALDDDGTLRYRLTGVLRDSETAYPGFSNDRQFIAPALTWEPTEDTRVTLLASYLHALRGATAVFTNIDNRATDPAGNPRYNEFDHEQYRAGWEIEHRFNNTFTVRQNARYSAIDADLNWSTYAPGSAGRAVEDMSTFVIDNHLETRFDTGAIAHTVLTGVDYGTYKYTQQQGYGFIPSSGKLALNPAYDTEQEQSQTAIYLQDQMAYGPWLFVLGGRYDSLDGETTTAGGAPVEQDETEFSWRVGLSYVSEVGVVPYVNYTTSFTPNVGTLVSGAPAEPTTAEQVEAGVKYEIPGRNALISAAVYQIEQTDGVVFDASSGVNQQVQQDMRSRGLELELVASLAEGLNVSASYAYNDIEITEGATGTDGNTLSASPHHMISAYADYTFQDGPAAGFGLGGGVRYQSASWGNDANTFKNDSRYFVDASLHYDLGQVSPSLDGLLWKLSATNLLDNEESTCTSGYCYRTTGREVYTSVRARF